MEQVDAEHAEVGLDERVRVEGAGAPPGSGGAEPVLAQRRDRVAHPVEDEPAEGTEESAAGPGRRPPQRIERNVEPPVPGGRADVGLPVATGIETPFRAELVRDERALRVGPRRSEDPHPPVAGQLDRGRPHPAGGVEDQGCLAALGVRRVKQTDPGGEEHHGDRRGLGGVEGVGVAEELVDPDGDLLRVPPEPHQGHRPVADGPVGNVGPHRRDLAGDLESRGVGAWWHRRIQSGPHDQIGEVDPGGADAQLHLSRPGRPGADHALDERFGGTMAFDEDGSGHGDTRRG